MVAEPVNTRTQIYWNTLLKIPTQAISFVISVLVARILVPHDYGILSVAMMFTGYANLFTDFGFSAAIVQRNIRDSETLQSVFAFNFGLSTVLAVAFSVGSGFIAGFFHSPESRYVVIVGSSYFLISSFGAVPRALLRRDSDFKTLSLVDTGTAVSMSLVTLALALVGFSYWALLFGQLLPAVVSNLYLCSRVKWAPTFRYRHSAIKPLFDFGFWIVFKAQMEYGLGILDRLLLGRVAGLDALGIYDKAQSIATVPNASLISGLNAVLFSSFSHLQRDSGEVSELLKKGLTTISVVSFPIQFGLCLVASHFVVGLMGERWTPMVVPFRIINVSCALWSIGGLLMQVNVASGRYRAHTLRFCLAGLAFVASCLAFLRYGAVGISWAYLIYATTAVAVGLQLTLAATGVGWADVLEALRPATIASAIMAAVTELLSLALPAPTIINLLVLSGTGAIIYVLCLALEGNPTIVFLKRALFADWATLVHSKKGPSPLR
jgi:teichuronic acid exporter